MQIPLLKILLTTSLIASNAFADSSILSKVTVLSKDQPAPYAGVLLSPEVAKAVYGQLRDYDRQLLLNKSLQTSLDVSQQNEDLLKKETTELKVQNVDLQIAVTKASSNSFWTKALWCAIGVIATSTIVYATKR